MFRIKKLELKWETGSLTCNGCRRDVSAALSLSTPSDVNPVIWLRLCRDCITQVTDYVSEQKLSDDEWLKANGFVETQCAGCKDPLVLVATDYKRFDKYYCDECKERGC